MKRNKGGKEKQSPSKLGLTRHGKHRTDKCFFSLWFEIEHFAKLRRFCKSNGLHISTAILNSLMPIFSKTKLKAEDRRWIRYQISKRAGRSY